jgi:hypothetical protein
LVISKFYFRFTAFGTHLAQAGEIVIKRSAQKAQVCLLDLIIISHFNLLLSLIFDTEKRSNLVTDDMKLLEMIL